MHRRPLLAMLASYDRLFPGESHVVGRIRRLVEAYADCFQRTCRPGHITAAAWILSADRTRCLLTHHRKLDKWLQLGGHADGQWDVVDVALREATEESGLSDLKLLRVDGGLLPLDIDVHLIPRRFDGRGQLLEDAHEHHDLRFLLWAARDQPLEISDESHDLRWLTPQEIYRLTSEPSVLRMLEKARGWMG